MPNDIPGFYYDPARNKYFKIQANHVAPPGSQHSAQAVQTRRDQQAEQEQHRASSLQKRKLITPSRYLSHPLLGASLKRRIGDLRRPASEIISSQYASQIRPTTLSAFDVSADKFAIDPETKALYTTSKLRSSAHNEFCVTNLSFTGKSHQSRYLACHTTPIFDTFDLHAVCPLTPSVVVWASSNEPANTTSTISNLLVSYRYDDGSVPWPQWREDFGEWGSTIHRFNSRIWDIARCPGREDTLALGTSYGAMIARGVGRGGVSLGEDGLSFAAKARDRQETMSVAFKDANVFMAGSRNGNVLFGDVRGGSAVRLRHSSAVSGLRALRQDHHVLVAGLQTVCVYDLRWPSTKSDVPLTVAHPGKSGSPSSKPVLRFDLPFSLTQKRYGLGFDYDRDMNVVALASTDLYRRNKVTLWNASSGKVIEDGVLHHKEWKEHIGTLQFVELEEGAPRSLVLSRGDSLEAWNV